MLMLVIKIYVNRCAISFTIMSAGGASGGASAHQYKAVCTSIVMMQQRYAYGARGGTMQEFSIDSHKCACYGGRGRNIYC